MVSEHGQTLERRPALLLIAIALAAFGAYRALYAVAMLPAPASILMLLAFSAQAVLAIFAAMGVWRQQRWAAAVLLGLGASIAVTALLEAFVLGIIPWLIALVVAIAAIAGALSLGAYVGRSAPPLDR